MILLLFIIIIIIITVIIIIIFNEIYWHSITFKSKNLYTGFFVLTYITCTYNLTLLYTGIHCISYAVALLILNTQKVNKCVNKQITR